MRINGKIEENLEKLKKTNEINGKLKKIWKKAMRIKGEAEKR